MEKELFFILLRYEGIDGLSMGIDSVNVERDLCALFILSTRHMQRIFVYKTVNSLSSGCEFPFILTVQLMGTSSMDHNFKCFIACFGVVCKIYFAFKCIDQMVAC